MTQPALASFGAGRLFVQNTDIVPATPIEFGVLQGCDFDFSYSTKPLFGSNQFAVFVARGEAKWSMKAKAGVMSGQLINSLFFGQTLVAGQTGLQASEAHTVPLSIQFTVAVAPPSSGAFVADEGVVYSATGQPLTLVTNAPGVGQYEQVGGVYTFSSLDEGALIAISYTYSFSGAGQKVVLTNQLLGTTPFFAGVFRGRDPRSGLYNTLVINRMTSSKLSLSSKTSDYTIPEFDAEIMDDGTGNIGTMSFGDLS
jgi:hypothetical protein